LNPCTRNSACDYAKCNIKHASFGNKTQRSQDEIRFSLVVTVDLRQGCSWSRRRGTEKIACVSSVCLSSDIIYAVVRRRRRSMD